MVWMFDLIGIAGMVILLFAFTLNVKKHTKRRTILFNSLNFIGAMLLFVYALLIQSQVFMALQLIWAAVAIYFVFSIVKEKHSSSKSMKRFSAVKKKKK
ncbi:MAG: hypothetical protein WCW44_02805 [archaeon]|jgi:lipid-A-disaccharide synthase-like uncharacterized protein